MSVTPLQLQRARFCLPVLLSIALLPVSLLPAAEESDVTLSPDSQVSLAGVWKSRVGDDPAWASPAFDDTGWTEVLLPATWEEQGYAGLEGYLWYRRVIHLHLKDFQPNTSDPLGLLVGPMSYGHYELYVNGRLTGRYGDPSLKAPIPSARVYFLPHDALGPDGRLVVALRVWRAGLESEFLTRNTDPANGIILLGRETVLRDRLELVEKRGLLGNLPNLLFSLLFLVVSAYHLHLYHRRRTRKEYLWFGLLAFAFAVNTFVVSLDWVSLVTDRRILALRFQEASGHLIAFASIQFLWPLLSLRIGRVLRAYQLSHVGLTVLAFAPYYAWMLKASTWLWLWLLPLLLFAATVIIREAWRGNPEARTISLGVLVLVTAELTVLTGTVLGQPWTFPLSLPMVGFAAVVFSMALSLSNRFSRVYTELDELRKNLEGKVEERTTALQDANRELDLMRRHNELILNSAGEGIFGLDRKGSTTFVNPAAVQMLGWQPEELLDRSQHDLIHHSHADGTPYSRQDCPVSATLREGKVLRVDNEVFWRKDGSPFPVEYHSNPIRGEDGEITGAVVTFQDITQRREVDQMKDEFISVVSHELRTPLTSIRGSLGLLEGELLGTVNEKVRRMLEIAVSNTDRLVRLINDILDVERIESTRVDLKLEECDALALMSDAAEAVRAVAANTEVQLEVSPAQLCVWADPDRIIQTLINLLGNAIKFSPPGSTVLLSVEQQGEEALFQVQDQGRGIPAEKLQTIFERFQQVDTSDTRAKDGSGLGLAICRGIVRRHGGRIWAESEPEKGSIFYFTLPTYPAQNSPADDPLR